MSQKVMPNTNCHNYNLSELIILIAAFIYQLMVIYVADFDKISSTVSEILSK